MKPIISVVGKSNSGKTGLLEKIVPELKKRGYRVGVIKHTKHQFEIDYPGKDTYRMTRAGADTVAIVSPEKLSLIKKLKNPPTSPFVKGGEEGDLKGYTGPPLDELVQWLFPDVDIVITEGFKQGNKPKIEVNRQELGKELLCRPEELLAVVSDQKFDLGVPVFGLDEVGPLTDFVVQRIILRPN